jgi:hypothetical protein
MLSHGTGVCGAAENLHAAEAVIMINHVLMNTQLSEFSMSDNILGSFSTQALTGKV